MHKNRNCTAVIRVEGEGGIEREKEGKRENEYVRKIVIEKETVEGKKVMNTNKSVFRHHILARAEQLCLMKESDENWQGITRIYMNTVIVLLFVINIVHE